MLCVLSACIRATVFSWVCLSLCLAYLEMVVKWPSHGRYLLVIVAEPDLDLTIVCNAVKTKRSNS